MEASELSLDDESSWCSQSGGEESVGGASKTGALSNPLTRTHRTPSPRNKTSDTAVIPTAIDEAPSEKVKRRPTKPLSEIEVIGPTHSGKLLFLNMHYWNTNHISNSSIFTAVARKVTANAILAQNGSALVRNVKRQRSVSAPGGNRLVTGVSKAFPRHSTLLGVATMLLVILFISAGFLLYRIGIVKDKLGNSIALEVSKNFPLFL